MSAYTGRHWAELTTTCGSASEGTSIVDSSALSSLSMRPLTEDTTCTSWTTWTDRGPGLGLGPGPGPGPSKHADLKLSDVPVGNPVMVHTIRLLQFVKRLDDISCRHEMNRLSIPQLDISKTESKNYLDPFHNRNLNQKAVKELMRRAVVVIAVFNGYDNANKSSIDLLVDILSEYLTRLCQTIRKASDSSELRSQNDFIDVIDRVFHDMNVSDFESLRQYDSDIRLYNQNLIKEINRKMGNNDSMANSSKITRYSRSQADGDDSVVTTSPHLEPTLTLKSLLNSFKSGSTDDDNIFDLTPNNPNE